MGRRRRDVHALLLALTAAALVASAVAARRDAAHRALVGYLAAVLVADLVCLALAQALPPLPAGTECAAVPPHVGWVAVARHVYQGAYIVLLLAPAGLALRVFGTRRLVELTAAGLALWAIVVATYPALRCSELLTAYTAAELCGGLCAVLAFCGWLRRRDPREAVTPPQRAAIVVGAGSLAVVALPQLAGAELLEAWPAVQALNAVVMALVLGVLRTFCGR
jgi:hypothetical protein